MLAAAVRERLCPLNHTGGLPGSYKSVSGARASRTGSAASPMRSWHELWGSGLGLSLARAIADLHGASIALDGPPPQPGGHRRFPRSKGIAGLRGDLGTGLTLPMAVQRVVDCLDPERHTRASHSGAKGGRTKRWSFGSAAMAARSLSSSAMPSASRLAFWLSRRAAFGITTTPSWS